MLGHLVDLFCFVWANRKTRIGRQAIFVLISEPKVPFFERGHTLNE